MKKLIVCSIVMLGALAIGSQIISAQACGADDEKPKTEEPIPTPVDPTE